MSTVTLHNKTPKIKYQLFILVANRERKREREQLEHFTLEYMIIWCWFYIFKNVFSLFLKYIFFVFMLYWFLHWFYCFIFLSGIDGNKRWNAGSLKKVFRIVFSIELSDRIQLIVRISLFSRTFFNSKKTRNI